MVEQRVLSPEQITELGRRLAELSWSWSVSEVDRVVAEVGWTVAAAPHPGNSSAVARTGLPVDGLADLVLMGDGMGEIVVRVSDPEERETPGATAFNRDAFATSVRALSAILGEPVERRPGAAPEVRWSATSGVLRVSQGAIFVELALMSVPYAELRDKQMAEPFDDEFAGDDW